MRSLTVLVELVFIVLFKTFALLSQSKNRRKKKKKKKAKKNRLVQQQTKPVEPSPEESVNVE